MPPAKLRKTDALALFGLVRYPEQPQREIAERLGLRVSTLNAAKKRLEKGGLATTVALTSGLSLGFDSLIVSFREYSLTGPVALLARTDRRIAQESRRTFFGIYENLQGVSLTYARGEAEVDRYRALAAKICSTDGAVPRPEVGRQEVLRLRDVSEDRAFDFSTVIAAAFDLPMPEDMRPPVPTPKGTVGELPDPARRVFRHLIQKPTATDSQTANALGRSRQSVARLRQRLEDDGFLRRIVVPDLKRIGVHSLSATLLDFAAGSSSETRREGREWSLRELPVFTYLTSDARDLVLTASVDMHAARGLSSQVPPKYFVGPYKQRTFAHTMFAVERADLHTFVDFKPLVEDALAVK